MPRSNKPRNFANPKIKLVNLKITPTKYKIQNTKKKKKKKKTNKFDSQKQNPNPNFAHKNTKIKKLQPIQWWVCNW